MVYVIQVCWQLASRIRMELMSSIVILMSFIFADRLRTGSGWSSWVPSWSWCHTGLRAGSGWSSSQAVSKTVWHIPLLCVQWKTPDDGQRNCSKHRVSFQKYVWEISASSWFYYEKFNTMYGHVNVKNVQTVLHSIKDMIKGTNDTFGLTPVKQMRILAVNSESSSCTRTVYCRSSTVL